MTSLGVVGCVIVAIDNMEEAMPSYYVVGVI